ncbi:MAG TPA: hypothetical protein VFC54_12310 [Pseudolabrys sp.]|nr:hypothetical protein [Pseudolabrys sp.]
MTRMILAVAAIAAAISFTTPANAAVANAGAAASLNGAQSGVQTVAWRHHGWRHHRHHRHCRTVRVHTWGHHWRLVRRCY